MPNSLNITKERINQISDIAISYVQKDKSLFDNFIHSYYQSLHQEMAEAISNADLAGMALHHFTLLKSYVSGNPQLSVLNPKAEEQHFHSSHTVIQVVAYDRPFLVDTILMSLEAEGIVRTISSSMSNVMTMETPSKSAMLKKVPPHICL